MNTKLLSLPLYLGLACAPMAANAAFINFDSHASTGALSGVAPASA